jgi:hypothetical protein
LYVFCPVRRKRRGRRPRKRKRRERILARRCARNAGTKERPCCRPSLDFFMGKKLLLDGRGTAPAIAAVVDVSTGEGV